MSTRYRNALGRWRTLEGLQLDKTLGLIQVMKHGPGKSPNRSTPAGFPITLGNFPLPHTHTHTLPTLQVSSQEPSCSLGGLVRHGNQKKQWTQLLNLRSYILRRETKLMLLLQGRPPPTTTPRCYKMVETKPQCQRPREGLAMTRVLCKRTL
jgi:hypothetical protein